MSGINGGALPKAMLNWGWGGTPGPEEGVRVLRWGLSLGEA